MLAIPVAYSYVPKVGITHMKVINVMHNTYDVLNVMHNTYECTQSYAYHI
jgi:hypothetical protein